MSAIVGHEFDDLADPKNMGSAVGTVFLCVVEPEIYVLPVLRPPSWFSGVGQRRRLSVTSLTSRPTPKT